MTLSQNDRETIAMAFKGAIPAIEEMFHIYARKAGAPERFAISVFDASGAGDGSTASANPEGRVIAEHAIKTADWGERNYSETAGRKFRAALRTGRDTGDLARNAKELFQEGDMASPGACPWTKRRPRMGSATTAGTR